MIPPHQCGINEHIYNSDDICITCGNEREAHTSFDVDMATHNKEGVVDLNKLASFPCPSVGRSGSMCVFASMKDIENKKGLRCKSEACQIRIPLET
jgi:hypothetical protein